MIAALVALLAASVGAPRPCVHGVDEPRPDFTRADQERVGRR